jgi:hypothetical protein
LNVVVFLRLNKPLGIPDEIFVLGSDAFMSVVGIWAHIPAVVMYSQLCPDKVEATMYISFVFMLNLSYLLLISLRYALLAGTSNFGRNLAAHQGAFIMDYLGMVKRVFEIRKVIIENSVCQNIASSLQIFQKCQNFLKFCVGNYIFLKNLMGTCNTKFNNATKLIVMKCNFLYFRN